MDGLFKVDEIPRVCSMPVWHVMEMVAFAEAIRGLNPIGCVALAEVS